MPDAHEAAVEAMATALDSGGQYRCGVCEGRDLFHEADYAGATNRALAALASSEAVRAALVRDARHQEIKEGVKDGSPWRTQQLHIVSPCCLDAILAALAGEDGGCEHVWHAEPDRHCAKGCGAQMPGAPDAWRPRSSMTVPLDLDAIREEVAVWGDRPHITKDLIAEVERLQGEVGRLRAQAVERAVTLQRLLRAIGPIPASRHELTAAVNAALALLTPTPRQ